MYDCISFNAADNSVRSVPDNIVAVSHLQTSLLVVLEMMQSWFAA